MFVTRRDTWRESGWLVASDGNVAVHYDAGLVREHTEGVNTLNRLFLVNRYPRLTVYRESRVSTPRSLLKRSLR